MPNDFDKLLFTDYQIISEALMRERGREAKSAAQNAAFTAWLNGAGGDENWGKFLKRYNLADTTGKVKTKEQRQAEIKANYKFADDLLKAMDEGKIK